MKDLQGELVQGITELLRTLDHNSIMELHSAVSDTLLQRKQGVGPDRDIDEDWLFTIIEDLR